VSVPFVSMLAGFFGLAAFGMPVAYAMFVVSIAYLLFTGADTGLFAEQMLNGLFDSFVLLAVPLFILAANLMNVGGVSDRLLGFCQALVGRLKGGLAQVDILVSVVFAGMSGSAIADAAGPGKLVTMMMVKTGRYPPGFAAAVACASAVIGPIIPPSIPMVIYALISDTSVGYLFLGGVVPGLLLGGILMLLVAVVSEKRGFPRGEIVPLRQFPRLTVQAFPALMLPVILLWGIYGGATTPTEAAALAAAYALALASFFYRTVGFRDLVQLLIDSSRSTAVVAVLIGGAFIFNYIIATEGIPDAVAGLLEGTEFSPLAFLLIISLIFLGLGCFFDATTLLLVVVPLFIPACRALGIDLVHFGVVTTVNIMIGLVTPPYGVLLFVMNGVTGIPLKDIIREIWPFVAVLLVALLIMILVPDIVLWLPRQFGYVG
jgi:tripartite ATP-independent transporter DctM subunit